MASNSRLTKDDRSVGTPSTVYLDSRTVDETSLKED